ncbi:MAG: response regulator [Archangiaceae bacterium]|nr:response regulator [Archangiaceae bacterium]
MTSELDAELNPLVDAIIAVASLDFSRRVPVLGRMPVFDGIATGLNMLADELVMRLEEERALRARLLHSDRLAAVGQLAAGMAHEVNNPATYVLANLDFLARNLAKHRAYAQAVSEANAARDEARLLELSRLAPSVASLDESARLISECREGMRRIVSVVTDLRIFSRSEGQDETLDLNELLEVAVRMVKKTITYRAQLVVELEPLPITRGNRARLTQAFTNLLVNAGQAIAEGSPDTQRVRVHSSVLDGELRVVIEDTGVGMTPEVQRRIFEPFFTTKPPGEGTGLGLSLTAEIVHQHGGVISFTSTPGKGTTFELRLPPRIPVRRREAPPPPVTPAPERLRVLLIDDEPLVLRAYQRGLRDDFDVTATTSGGEAIELLRRNPYDSVVCDLMMPDTDGLAVYEAALAHRPELALSFIFVSGGPFTERTRRLAVELGDALVRKPVDFETLKALIILRGRREG